MLAIVVLMPAVSTAADDDSSTAADDEVWLISTRGITSDVCCANVEAPDLAVSRYDGRRLMLRSDLETLIQTVRTDSVRPNVIYVHGNNFKADEAIERAWFVRHQIRCQRGGPVPMRFIIFSWPSEQVTTVLKDIRIKADRTDAQGLYLAFFLRSIVDAPLSVTLIGYSFGGRVATGALHALAGGPLDGRRLSGETVTGFEAKLGLIAPALDRDWLLAGEYHGKATLNIDQISLMYNPRDQVLRRYWLLEPGGLSRALGSAGPIRFGNGADGRPVQINSHNCSRTVGRRHREEDYFSAECNAGRIMARMINSP
jgi:hypothetical protein